MEGFSLLIGNDLTGGRVLPLPEVVSKPLTHTDLDYSMVDVCSVCAVTRAQARKANSPDLAYTFMSLENPRLSFPRGSSGDSAPRPLFTSIGEVPMSSKPRFTQLEITGTKDQSVIVQVPCYCCGEGGPSE